MFAGVAVRVAVQASAVQQRLMLLGKEYYPSQPIPCVIDGPSCRKAQFTSDVCNRLSADLGELHYIALTLLHRGLLDFLHDPFLPLSGYILNFYYSTKLKQSQESLQHPG